MAGRPKSFNVEDAYEAFVDVFWTNGYQGTSVDDLQKAAGIQRGSFYAAFGSKDDVFAEVLTRYWDEATEVGLSHLEEGDDPRAAVARFIHHVGEFMTVNTPRGCLLLSSSGDPSCTPAGENSLVRRRMRLLESRIFNTLSSSPELPEKKVAKDLTAYVLSTLLGLNAMAKTGQDADKIRAASDIAANSVLSASV